MALTRTFTRDELNQLGLPDQLPQDRVLLDKPWALTTDRSGTRQLIFRLPEDEETWQIFYEAPISSDVKEYIDPWNGAPTVEAARVELRTVSHTSWHRVDSPQD